MTDGLRQEHGRLLARLRRQIGKAERFGITDDRARKIRRTLISLIVTEKLQAMDPLHAATVQASAARLEVLSQVSDDEIRLRLAKLSPGAGLVIAR